MMLRIQWTILLSIFAIMLMGCNPPIDDPLTEILQSDDQCEIQLGGYSIHDVIQIFESPRFDLHNPMGSLYFPTGCTDDCPLTSVTVQGTMSMSKKQCEADQQTCGVWYQVSWRKYADGEPISGWISERDEDIRFVGNCDNLLTVTP